MFLKRITLSGFKSFADRVDFDFGPGVTCVVGPNGCGKSNILDSIRWVLGEQSARSLRGRQMTDMIFNGSTTRKASSVAQVDLHFGNDDRKLPIDEDVVVITRKLYRSGESDYLLNNHGVRLKDIRELFMDTGVGVDAYSVIEQGRVDGLLQNSPIERRHIFEEAAGISKYKARRKEAQRKLERTQQNLLRVEDIVEELEKRLRSVKLQAGKARNYRQYAERLKELRATFALAEFHRFTQERERLGRDLGVHSDRVTELRADISRHEAQDAQITSKLDELHEKIAGVDNELVRAKSEQAGQQERIEAAQQRIEEQQHVRTRGEQRLTLVSGQIATSQEELADGQAVITDLNRQHESKHELVSTLREQDGELARRLTESKALLEEEKAGIIDLLRKSAQVHNEIVRLNSQRESLVDQKGRLTARRHQIGDELALCDAQRSDLARQVADLDVVIQGQKESLEQQKAEASRIDAARQQFVDELAGLKERRSALESRRELLEDLQQKRDGIGAGVRQVLSIMETTTADAGANTRADASAGAGADAEEARAGVLGLVADFVDADVTHARLVESALGDRDQHLVISDTPAFLRQLARCGPLEGRFTAICLDRIPPTLNERDFSDSAGFVARLIDWVRVPREAESLARHVFGKTIVVEQLDNAIALATEDVRGHRFVTLTGEVVEPDGRITLGPPASGTGLISRRSELRDIAGQMSRLEEQVAEIDDKVKRTKAEASYLDTVQQELRAAIYDSNTARVELNASMQKLAESMERLLHERPVVEHELALVEQHIEEVHSQVGQRSGELEALEQENQRREALVTQHDDSIERIGTERQSVQDQLTEAKVAAGQIMEKRTAAIGQVEGLKSSLRNLESSAEETKHDILQCAARIEDALKVVAAGREAVVRLAADVAEFENQGVVLRGQREQLRIDSEQRSEQLKRLRSSLEQSESAHHDTEMKLAETNIRRDDLSTRIESELGIDLDEQYEGYEQEDRDWEQVESEIEDLRVKMSRLGNVNLDAIDELAAIEERHVFLTTQRDDLTSSRRQLEQLIGQLDQDSRKRFQAAFIQIRDNFRALFRKLFGGGRADIVLEDPENIIECGIEIVAQPPGKELQIISLMSGGEKSLTAIALLMSIFKCRPAPFAILDEVDAALDEANNERFNRIIQEFMSESQFIIITHSRRTMAIGDQLYGITMQEPGVSSRVSVQLSDAHAA